MVIRGNNNIFRRVESPALTLFEQDFQEWIDLRAQVIVGEVYDYIERQGLDKDDYALVRRLEKIAINEASEFEQIVPDEMHIVIAEGSFGTGKRACTVTNAYKLSSRAHSKLWEKVIEYDIGGYFDVNELLDKLYKTNFEYTLRRYIPAIFKDDLIDWAERVPEEIVEEASIVVFDRKLDPKEVAREIIIDEIDEIIKQLHQSGSVYVSIVEADSDEYKETTCQIVTISEFANKLYKVAYNNVLNYINKY
jgi:hypothetical protein